MLPLIQKLLFSRFTVAVAIAVTVALFALSQPAPRKFFNPEGIQIPRVVPGVNNGPTVEEFILRSGKRLEDSLEPID